MNTQQNAGRIQLSISVERFNDEGVRRALLAYQKHGHPDGAPMWLNEGAMRAALLAFVLWAGTEPEQGEGT